MGYEIVWTESVLVNLDAILDYLGEANPDNTAGRTGADHFWVPLVVLDPCWHVESNHWSSTISGTQNPRSAPPARSMSEDVMAKRRRHVPRYLREDPAWREAETRRQNGIPIDAILADLSQQAPNNSCSPPLFYVDCEFTCVDCGSLQIWTAEQQKWWYEVAKGSIYSGAKRCRPCRAAFRAVHQGITCGTQPRRRLTADELSTGSRCESPLDQISKKTNID